MKFILHQIKTQPDAPKEYALQSAVRKAAEAGIAATDPVICHISVDSRNKNDIKTVYSVVLAAEHCTKSQLKKLGASEYEEIDPDIKPGNESRNGKIAVIGFGPAGMFAALMLEEYGYDTVIYERGADVRKRSVQIENFKKTGILDTVTNVQFGAGGAGMFSDGKLITRINDPICNYVLKKFVSFGAPDDILVNARPHIGTDMLQTVIENVSNKLISSGAVIRYETKVTDIKPHSGGVSVTDEGNNTELYDAVILAVGHSARDAFQMIYTNGFEMVKKPFSVGCRIEHLQRDIDLSMYGKQYEKYSRYLPHAEYNLSYREGGAGVYSFCMCPGGRVVCASSEEGGIVTNGMSYHNRDGSNANSAVVVSVGAEDTGSGLFSGVEFQRTIEKAAYSLTNGFVAPAENVGSFLRGEKREITNVKPTYEPGVELFDIKRIFPDFINNRLAAGLFEFDKKIKGFASSFAMLTAPETRTSSPLRILRTEERCSVSSDRIYPCGEGAGYAGGITSAAVDGIKSAIKIIERFKPDK